MQNRKDRGRPLAGLGLTAAQLRLVQMAAQTVPVACRQTYFARVAAELAGRELGDGVVWRAARSIAKALAWNVERA
jgi:hypothetical protein